MAGEKKIETSDSVAAVLKSAPFMKLVEQDVVSGNGTPSILNSSMSSSGDATSGIKGYNGNFSQLNDQNHFKAGDGSVIYYMPGYDPYATGPFMGVDGQQPYYSSTGYLQHPVSYGSEAMPCYTWNSACVGDVANGSTGFPGKSKSAHGSNTSTKSNGFNSIKSSGTPASKFSTLPLDSKSRRSAASTNVSKSFLESQPFKTGGKLRSGYQSAGLDKGFHPVGKFSSYIDQNQGLLMHNSPMSYRSNGRVWNGNSKYKSRDKHGEFDTSTELTRGPRAQNGTNPSNPSEEQLGPTVRRELYNLEEFQTEYDNAKFFVIKSYSEDDIHKCISYDVWSSTPNGNKKLDAAFRDAETKASETGTKCPVFLFFSVNGSGQFVGVAEMIGPVDFNKDMGFWQLDKWNGVFPVKWHVLKDTPNTQLRHIILENNDNRPVTFSRDTQEIGLQQGIEMLNIFKSYLAKNSILDDFDFYENREKLLKAKVSNKKASSQTDIYNNHDFPNHLERMIEEAARPKSSDPTPSLINLTKNLSLNSHPLRSGAVKNPRETSVPPTSGSQAI